jgi:methylenetetrahydrofolate reductase (NADPH)
MVLQVQESTTAAVPAGLADAISALARAGSLETSTRNLAEVDGYTGLVPAGTDVYAPWLPGAPYHHQVAMARHLRRAGFNPVPHISARRLPDAAAARDFLGRLQGEAGVERVLAIAGDSQAAAGAYDSSSALIETGLLQEYGIRSIGVAGYPEGHRKIPDAVLDAALDAKIAFARRASMDLFIVSQFCFDGGAIVDWLHRLRARGVTTPVRVGVAGPATVRALINYGLRCGIGNSLRAIGSQAISLPRLVVQQGPEKVVRRVALEGKGLGIAGLHCFAFGDFANTARWMENVASGRFRLDAPGESFSLTG